VLAQSLAVVSEPANEGVFRYFMRRPHAADGMQPVTAPSDPKHDYYRESGAHPDVVERLWDQLGKGLPVDSRALLFGSPALVHPQSGIVLAFALGTEYAMRLPRGRTERPPAGLRTVAKWTGGGSTDIQRECGKEWIFGSFADAEVDWCQEIFEECRWTS
jgi:hypothetical protein